MVSRHVSRGEALLPEYSKPYAVVVGLDDGTTGLQTARILAKRNVPVVGIAGNPRHFCCYTNSCKKIFYSSTVSDELIDTLERIGPQFPQKPVLFPCQDQNVLLVSRNRERLATWYHFVLPSSDTVEMLMDKALFAEFAKREQLAIPRTEVVWNEDDVTKCGRKMQFPCIVKPDLRRPFWNNNISAKAFRVSCADELMSIYRTHQQWADAFVVQEWIPGDDMQHFTCNGYFDRHSQAAVSFTTQKIRQWPPTTGQGCLGVECRNEAVANTMKDVFSRLDFRGLCYLEMKKDARSGKYLIIEPNIGRPTGRSATAEAAGIELMYTMYCDALGWAPPKNLKQPYSGVKWIHWRRDIQAALHACRHGQLNLREVLRSWRGKKTTAIMSWRDPLPFLLELLLSMRKFVFRFGRNRSRIVP